MKYWSTTSCSIFLNSRLLISIHKKEPDDIDYHAFLKLDLGALPTNRNI